MLFVISFIGFAIRRFAIGEEGTSLGIVTWQFVAIITVARGFTASSISGRIFMTFELPYYYSIL
jgi:hypothetical protein